MATFAGKCYVANCDATPLLSCDCVDCCQISAEKYIATTLDSLITCVENLVSQFSKKPENVANRSISCMQSRLHSGSLQEGTSKHWSCRKPTQRQAWPAGDQAWFNSRIFAGDKSGVAGVELATASEPPARQPRICERRPLGVDPRHP